jgi:transposase
MVTKKIREFILKGKEIYVGLEDSKKTWKVCVRSGRTVVHETSMPAKYDVLSSYFRNKFPECKIRVLYEAGFRGFNLCDKLIADGWDCVVTPAHTVTQEKCNKQKNDRIDCRRLAKNNENDDFGVCDVPDCQRREDRQISRLCNQLQKDITRTCNRIRREMEYHGLEEHFPTGNWSPRHYREAEKTIKDLPISDSLKFSFEVLFDQLTKAREAKLKVVRRLRELSKSERYKSAVKIVSSSPGIGWFTAIRRILELRDVKRFRKKQQFASFLGLIPSDYSTGEQDHKGHITKQGNRHIRAWLIEAAWIAIRYDPVLLEKYQNVVAHSGSTKKAIVAVARKLAMSLRSILLSGEEYQLGLEDALITHARETGSSVGEWYG